MMPLTDSTENPHVQELEAEFDCTLTGDVCESVRFEYHIIYSHSYRQPVLFFNAHRQDGRPLTLCEVWENVPDLYRGRLDQDKWSILTQQEHPILGRPYLTVHPCHTDHLMAQMPLTRNYVVSWLSVFGPLVGLDVPVSYARIT